jgi:Holliday junction resolvase RusA-like endonuclease
MDALPGIAFDDDSQIVEAHVRKGYDKERPRVEVTIQS